MNKDGHLYVMTADDLAASALPIQRLALNNAYDGPGVGGLIGVPAFWPESNMLFVTDAGPGINGINAGVVGLTVNPAPACDLGVSWSVPLPVVDPNQPPSSPTVAGGVVFVGTANGGAVHAYDAATGTVLWDSRGAITGGATFVAPMVASGNLYVGSWDGFANSDGGTIRAFSLVPGVILGDQAIESQVDGDPTGVAEAFQTTVTASGAVTALHIYLDASSTATKLVAGLYADSAGHPGALISQGSTINLVAPGWNVIPLSFWPVDKGTPYWIAVLGTQSGALGFRDGTGGCVSETSQENSLTALPLKWTTGASTLAARSRRTLQPPRGAAWAVRSRSCFRPCSGCAFENDDAHPLNDRRSFMKSSHPPFLFDQHCGTDRVRFVPGLKV
ncbi:MAG TPA: PQQ-binding-like beta-propeller repeat protein [Myxococcota bacterium]|nr:PQQ-binding-like beta-propeller repeat protein [Myxococcota bacterium]